MMKATQNIQIYLLCFLSFLITCPSYAETTSTVSPDNRGEILGGIKHTMPEWFKESFLEIQEDVDEARAEGKHVMLFFHLDDCPYCDRMINESLDATPMKDFIQKHFDVIAINIKGDREIAFDENTSVTEKRLSQLLKVRYTPNLFFLNHNNKAVVRLTGYRPPDRLQKVMTFVQEKAYQTTTLADYLEKNLTKAVYSLRPNPLFQEVKDLSTIKGPLAVIFEDSRCTDCDYLHDKLLKHPEVLSELGRFTVVRLNADAKGFIIDPQGKQITAYNMAKKFNVTYRPGIVLFDQGKEVTQITGLVYPFHFRETFRFVGSGAHLKNTYREYMTARKEALLDSGIDVDYSE